MFTKIILIFILPLILAIFADTTENPVSQNDVKLDEKGSSCCFFNTCNVECAANGYIGGFCVFDKCNCYPHIGKMIPYHGLMHNIVYFTIYRAI